MTSLLLSTIWLMLPAAVANAIPPFSAKIFPKWTYPLDFNKKFRGKRIFGGHKTFRGLITGTLFSQMVYLLQKNYTGNLFSNSQILLSLFNDVPIYFGFTIGFFALMGDSLKSFFKRQIGVKPGKSFFPFDQIDWVITSYLYISIYIGFNSIIFFYILLFGLTISLISKFIGWKIKINDTYF